MCFTDPAQGMTSANYIADNALGTKIAVITNVSDPYSTGIRDAFLDVAEERGLEIVSETEFNDGDADFSVQVNDAKNAGADLVFLPIYYGPASMIIPSLLLSAGRYRIKAGQGYGLCSRFLRC